MTASGTRDPLAARIPTGLVLSGGGARGGYQAGVLRGLLDLGLMRGDSARVQPPAQPARCLRGGSWYSSTSYLAASDPVDIGPSFEGERVGFRVASLVPECGDGIDNDADTLVDFPADPGCSSPLDATEASPPDSDGDLVDDSLDNCPYEPNPAQTDVGGVGAAPPDGIGDACQCGDTNDSGTVTATDATVLSRAIAGLSPYYSVASGLGGGGPGLAKCNVGAVSPGVAGCTASDATVIERAVSLLGPGIAQNCDAALP